jgi:apolipoprotein N-acyltransferase
MTGSFVSRLANRYLLAIAGGLLMAASFPNIGMAGLAWLAPGLMLFAGAGLSGWQAFRVGYLAGLMFWAVALYWLLLIPFPAGAVAGWAALSAYLASYCGVWVWLCWKLAPGSKSPAHPVIFSDSLRAIAECSWSRRLGWTVTAALAWVALEMVMARLLSGFPWNFAGVSQYRLTPLIQIASVTGVYGVSFLLVWFSVSLGCALILLARQPFARAVWLRELALPMITVALVFSYGFQRLGPEQDDVPTLKIAMIQPSIPQLLIWNPEEDEPRFEALMQLSREALQHQPDLLVWPEAALPGFTEARFIALTNMIADHRVWMVFGADDFELREGPGGVWQTNYYNSSFLFHPGGGYVASYHKRRLVIFGEYIPLGRWLPFMRYLTPVQGGFTPGDQVVRFDLPPLQTSMKILICFEDVFPHYTREYVDPDTDILLNLTNNGWFRESAAHWQHAISALFRAVENGIPLVRCTNNGLTCWIDRHGRMREVFRGPGGSIYEPGYLISEVPLRAAGGAVPPTFYRRYGDWFGWAAVLVTAGLFGVQWARDRKRRGVIRADRPQ